MTEEEANRLFKYWVKVLHLEDWEIVFKWKVRANDMNLEKSVGCNSYNETDGSSLIQILDEDEYNNDLFPMDYEKTLVHELLHLKFAFLDDSGDAIRDSMTHRLINDMSKALVEARRSDAKD